MTFPKWLNIQLIKTLKQADVKSWEQIKKHKLVFLVDFSGVIYSKKAYHPFLNQVEVLPFFDALSSNALSTKGDLKATHAWRVMSNINVEDHFCVYTHNFAYMHLWTYKHIHTDLLPTQPRPHCALFQLFGLQTLIFWLNVLI